MAGFFNPQSGETPATIKQKRDLIKALMSAQRAPQNVGEGISALGDGIVAAILDSRADKAEQAGLSSAENAWGPIGAALSGGGDFPSAPAAPPRQSGGRDMGQYRDAIASIESAGSGDYGAIGPTHPEMGRALGRYQVMESNIGPWSEAALGRKVTSDEFLKDPKLQDAIFDHQFGSYVEKYGPDKAAHAWFAGPGGIDKTDRKDVLGTTVGGYEQKFRDALGTAPAPSASPEADFIRYANQGATRSQPLSPEMQKAMSFLPELGVTMEVFSGGQPGKGEGGARVGSERHDHGGAGDAFFYKGDRRLDWANPEDQPVFQEIVKRAKAAGLTGFGAGEGYMRPGSMHLGFGAPAVWGAGGSSANAPDWLRQAYEGGGQQVASLDPSAGMQQASAAPQQQPMAQIAQMLAQSGNNGLPEAAGLDPNPINLNTLMQAGGNEFMSPQRQAIIKMLMEQELKKRDPAYALELENTRSQIADRDIDNRREDERFGFEKAKAGEQSKLDREKFGLDVSKFDYEKQKDSLPEYYDAYVKQETAAGRQPLGILEYITATKKAGASNTNVTVGGEPADGELRKGLDKAEGDLWAEYKKQGSVSGSMGQDFQILDELIKVAPQGILQGRLAEMFPGVSSAGDAFQSIVKRIAPTLRAPGSGATSDIEYDGMLKSLPALRNKPEANVMIGEIMKAKAALNMERADIITKYQTNDISAAEARRQMAALDKRSIMTPEMKQALEGISPAAQSNAPAAGEVMDGYRFKGGDPANQSNWERVE